MVFATIPGANANPTAHTAEKGNDWSTAGITIHLFTDQLFSTMRAEKLHDGIIGDRQFAAIVEIAINGAQPYLGFHAIRKLDIQVNSRVIADEH
jgi:hypothetical protein